MARFWLASAAALLVSWSAPAWSAYLMCQVELKQGTNCVEQTGTVDGKATLYVAITCQVCSGGGSDVKCDPAEVATASSLSLTNALNLPVAGTFSATGVTCDLGLALYKLSGGLAAGTYHLVVKAAGMESEVLTFTVGPGGTPGPDVGTGKKDGGGTAPKPDVAILRTEKGLPIALEPRPQLDERGNVINPGGADRGTGGGGGGADSGCGCKVSPAPAELALPGLLLLGALALRRRRR